MASEPGTSPEAEPELDARDDVVRFVPERRKFGHRRLFLPSAHGRLSVCIALERSSEALMTIGLRYVSEGCCGFARTRPEIYRTTLGLKIVRDDDPFPGHANVEMPVHDKDWMDNAGYLLANESEWVAASDATPGTSGIG